MYMDRFERWERFFIPAFFIVGIGMGACLQEWNTYMIDGAVPLTRITEIDERFKMLGYEPIKPAVYQLDGIYYADEYYCVWTKGESTNEIKNTECHEVCHDLIYDNWQHFCDNKKNIEG
jgi:hypothetical protein